MSNIRTYDIIVWGATGFTGQLVAEYIIRHYPQISLAIAGRSEAKLREVRNTLHRQDMPMLIAESHDYSSLFDMAMQAKVLITTVGPYIRYGEKLVKACIDSGTHYLDITGEPAFVQDILHKYHADALEKGTLVINCCGFDSVPADLGAYYTASLLRKEVPKTIKGYVSFNASFSGGTWASAMEAFSAGMKSLPKVSGGKGGRKIPQGVYFEKEIEKWVLPMPVIDPWMVKEALPCDLTSMATTLHTDNLLPVSRWAQWPGYWLVQAPPLPEARLV